jgi:hypothetical protein
MDGSGSVFAQALEARDQQDARREERGGEEKNDDIHGEPRFY